MCIGFTTDTQRGCILKKAIKAGVRGLTCLVCEHFPLVAFLFEKVMVATVNNSPVIYFDALVHGLDIESIQEPEYQSEDEFQQALFQWHWSNFPDQRRLLFHVPNGGTRNKIEAMRLKAKGVVPGVPDLGFFWKGRTYWFELKTQKGTLSPAQKKLHHAWDNYPNVIKTSYDFMYEIYQITS